MSKSPESTPDQTAIKQRLIACTQSPGRLSRSTVADALISWLTFAGVSYAAIDADPQHHTLSDRHDVTLLDPTASEDEFSTLVEALPTDAQTIIVDFPSQATARILEFSAHFGLLETFRQAGIRPTLLIFTADDSTAKDSAADTIEFFGENADYILIENSARFRSDNFKNTPLYDWFVERNTPTITIPRISSGTLAAWEAAQHEHGKGLSLDAVCKLRSLHPMRQLEIAGVRDRCLVQFEDCASRIVPDPSAITHRVIRASVPQGVGPKRPANRFGNKMLVQK